MLPDAWPLAHAAAGALGRRGAGEELLGNHGDAVKCYSRALCLFTLITRHAGGLPPSSGVPPLVLSAGSKARLSAVVTALGSRITSAAQAANLPVPELVTVEEDAR
jgi:hypothetical protein